MQGHLTPMSRSLRPILITAGLGAVLAWAAPTAASQRIYSYDSVTPITQKMTENGLTFVSEKSLLSLRVVKLLETQDIGAAELRPGSSDDLGRKGLDGILGKAPERDLYEITDRADGKALKHALCHADRAWLVFGRIKAGEPLRIHAVTYDPKSRQGRLCVTLDYSFHGQWALPVTPMVQPDRTDPFNDTPNNTLAGPPVGPRSPF